MCLSGAEESEAGLAFGDGGFDGEGEISRLKKRDAVRTGEDVAGFETGGVGQAAGDYGVDQETLRGDAEGLGDLTVHRTGAEAERREGQRVSSISPCTMRVRSALGMA